MTKPLEGLLVVSLEQAVAAPMAGRRLADAGARVIKLERPEGDFARGYDTAASGGSSYFVWLNRGKESVAVDLRRPEEIAFVQRLLSRADIFVENLAPGAVARLGLAADVLRRQWPRLITCSISGYGPGPFAARKAYDLLIQAESGLSSVTGTPDGPGRVGVSVVDIATGLNAYAGILEALHERHTTGVGRHVDVSLFSAISEWMTVPLLQYESGGKFPPRLGLAHPSIAPYGVFRCRDGVPVLLSIQNSREWQLLCRSALACAELADDPRFAENVGRVQHRDVVDARVSDAIGRYDFEELSTRLQQAGIAFGRLNDLRAFALHPHLHRMEVDTTNGPVSLPVPPSGKPGLARCFRVPELDQGGRLVRQEFSEMAAAETRDGDRAPRM
jgi:formyl-CoA transferase